MIKVSNNRGLRIEPDLDHRDRQLRNACWNEFAASLVILTTAGNQPMSVALTKCGGQYETSWHYVFGVSLVAILPVVLLFMLIEKRLVGGLTAGSGK